MDFILIQIMVIGCALVVGALLHNTLHGHTPKQALEILINAYRDVEMVAKQQGFDTNAHDAGLEVKMKASDGRIYTINMKAD